jgi:hypothetical protein
MANLGASGRASEQALAHRLSRQLAQGVFIVY